MKHLLRLLAHLLATLARLLGPGGAKAIVADSLLMKQQLLIVNRSRRRAPNLTPIDRIILGFWSLFLSDRHIERAEVILRPSTLLNFHDMLKRRKYRLLYTSRKKRKPGPKGPSMELIEVIVELKRRNPRFGCPRIAQQINKAFGLSIDKDVVRCVLAKHYRPGPGSGHGPSWLTFIGHLKDSLWSVDMFRCGSILLKTHWVLVIMDQFTRRIIGVGVHAGDVCGPALCRMFNKAIGSRRSPKYLSSDNDPLFQYRQWQAKEAMINSTKLVIASEARQSLNSKSVAWRLLRRCVPRNDELIRASLILTSWMSMKSKACPIHPAHIRSLSDSSEPSAGKFLITRCSGMRSTWSESWHFSKFTTISRERMHRWMAIRPLKSVVTVLRTLLPCTVTDGKSIAAAYSNCRLQLEY